LTSCSGRERVQTASQCAAGSMSSTSVRRRAGCRRRSGGLPLQAFIVGFLDFVVFPLDDRLRAELLEILQEFALPLVAEDVVGNLLPRRIERQRLLRARCFELQDLIPARGAKR